MQEKEFVVEESGVRLDKFLASQIPSFSRVAIQDLINRGDVKVNGKSCRKSDILTGEDEIQIILPDSNQPTLVREPFTVEVLFEDEHILVINKPANLVVHPGNGRLKGTLVNQLLDYNFEVFSSLLDEEYRSGIVHRLDQDTTGVMVVAKSLTAQEKLKSAFKGRSIQKDYLSLVDGILKEDEGEILTRYGRDAKNKTRMSVWEEGGREALTWYKCIAKHNKVSFLHLRLQTGRTHQNTSTSSVYRSLNTGR